MATTSRNHCLPRVARCLGESKPAAGMEAVGPAASSAAAHVPEQTLEIKQPYGFGPWMLRTGCNQPSMMLGSDRSLGMTSSGPRSSGKPHSAANVWFTRYCPISSHTCRAHAIKYLNVHMFTLGLSCKHPRLCSRKPQSAAKVWFTRYCPIRSHTSRKGQQTKNCCYVLRDGWTLSHGCGEGPIMRQAYASPAP